MRLIGDDQQLAAIGAGGVLRDIAATHGALRLSDELVRFDDPVEAAASLALRDGDSVGPRVLPRPRPHPRRRRLQQPDRRRLRRLAATEPEPAATA